MGSRRSTKFPGVQARDSSTRRYRGKPDVCYTIDYKDATGRRVRKDVGWASEGFTATLAAEMRARLVNEAKTAIAMGEDVQLVKKAPPTLAEAWKAYKRDWLEANGKHVSSDEALIKGAFSCR